MSDLSSLDSGRACLHEVCDQASRGRGIEGHASAVKQLRLHGESVEIIGLVLIGTDAI